MKWLAFISFIFLFSFAISRDLKRSARDTGKKDLYYVLIIFAQYFYKCPYDDIAKQVKNVVDLAHKCVANEQDPECLKPVPTIVLDQICKIDRLGEVYGEMANCCRKADPERNQCFLSFKHSVPGFLPPYQRPEPEVMCKTFQENKEFWVYEEKLRSFIQETQEIVKTNCDLHAHLGESDFLKAILIRYTRKMPQVSPQTLIEIAKKMAAVGSKCCQEAESRRIPCSERHLSLVIQNMCLRQEATPINEKVTHCCDDSYAERIPCFTKLGADESYKPLQFTPELFTFHEDLCTAPAETQQIKQLTFLVNLIKLKITITDEQLQKIFTDLTGIVQKCCKAGLRETCFAVEVSQCFHVSRVYS
uniref:Albumin domain-containing protein n=1 Tax=Gopherus agassizii TaxID=38772 RepID=A0A452H8E1_9SAUR